LCFSVALPGLTVAVASIVAQAHSVGKNPDPVAARMVEILASWSAEAPDQSDFLLARVSELGDQALPCLVQHYTGQLAWPASAPTASCDPLRARAFLAEALELWSPIEVTGALLDAPPEKEARTEWLLACRMIGDRGDARAFTTFLAGLDATGAQWLGSPAAREAVEQAANRAFSGDRSASLHVGSPQKELALPLRTAVGRALGVTSAPGAVDRLAQMMGEHEELDLAILAALGALQGAEGRLRVAERNALVSERLVSGSLELRRQAARVLGDIADPSALPLLVGALDDDDLPLRRAARASLTRMTGRKSPADSSGWNALLEREHRWMEKEVPRITTGLRSSEPARVVAALREVCEHGLMAPDLVPLVQPVLKRGESSVLLAALATFERLGDSSVLPSLVAMLGHSREEVRTQVGRVLCALSGTDLPAEPAAWRAWLED
jgi:HEAT repeat protein